ncbi:MAG: DUF3085 domain-containing protein [Cocleimonas sp.]
MATASISRKQASELYEFCKQHKLGEFFFAKDQGAYFGATNGTNEKGNFSNSIHYIQGCDPEQDEAKAGDWYDNSGDKFGGDDFGLPLPLDWLKIYFTDDAYSRKRTFGILINQSSVSLIC